MSVTRARIYQQLDPMAWPGVGVSPVNQMIISVILVSILAAVLESEPTIYYAAPKFFSALNVLFATAFTLEFGFRLWCMGENAAFLGLSGRVRFLLTFPSLVDLVVLASIWADVLLGVPGVYGVLLRLVRVLPALTLARKSRWARAIQLLKLAVYNRRLELVLSLFLAGSILLASATLLFAIEGHIQPEAFGSIPRAMWWATQTLTTVGCGDGAPLTTLGKFFASIVAFTAIAVVAMPTGIMAASFSDAFQRLRDS